MNASTDILANGCWLSYARNDWESCDRERRSFPGREGIERVSRRQGPEVKTVAPAADLPDLIAHAHAGANISATGASCPGKATLRAACDDDQSALLDYLHVADALRRRLTASSPTRPLVLAKATIDRGLMKERY